MSVLLAAAAPADADWPQFRGPGGLGIATVKKLPATWSDRANIAWKTALPGPGSSSPIVVANRIFITCYSGYGVKQGIGELKDLKRHLLCLDKTGKILWTRDVVTNAKDYPFGSFQALHGFASSTPVSDGKHVYCFFGVAGVVAFDLDGKQLWRTSVGTGTSDWGSGTSPVLVGDHVIVNASVESGSVVALNKNDGSVSWTQKDISYSWSTPLVIDAKGRKEVIVSMYQHLRAWDPKDGKLLWHCAGLEDYVVPTVAAADGVVFSIGARQNTALAVRAGGTDDVSDSHSLWKIKRGSNVCSPVCHDGYLYWTHEGRGTAYCVNARTGKIEYEEQLDPAPDRIYASAFLGDGKIYYVSRTGGTYVLEAGPKYKLLHHNVIADDISVFDGSPAVMDGKLLLRSNRFLYCIGAP
jgi:hypothetical protein